MNVKKAQSKPAIVIHGGAGTIPKADLTSEKEADIRSTLEESVKAGHQALLAGASSTDAVAAAIKVMEDSPLFNAGKGAVYNSDGKHEMDASIMEGKGLNAGAVASVAHIRNPIDLAIQVMTASEHVMLMGAGAEEFARQQGFEMTDPEYFHSDFRWQQLQRIKARESGVEANGKPAVAKAQKTSQDTKTKEDQKDQWFSTVGAVALDQQGNLAAGTSTGGTSNKRWGRVGDSPIIGAGTYANNNSCAVSATGHGEYFIRHVVAYNIASRVEQGVSVTEAAEIVVNNILVKAKGEGGIIAIDRQGNIATPFNSEGMYRASIDTDGKLSVSIYREEGETDPVLSGNVDH